MTKYILLIITINLISSNLYSNNFHIDDKRFFGFNECNLVFSESSTLFFSYLKENNFYEEQNKYNLVNKSSAKLVNLKLQFIGANFKEVYGKNKNYYNIFNINKIENKKYDNYEEIDISNIYEKINFKLIYNKKDYEFQFELLPNADINIIELEKNDFFIDEKGNITNNLFIITKPIAFYKNNPSQYININYEIINNKIKFNIDDYDNSKTIIIDPIIKLKGTYYGGISIDRFYDMDNDENKNSFGTGLTLSTGQIAFNGYQNIKDVGYDAFMVKFDSSGNRVWGTYFGGEYDDISFSCRVKNNNILMAGRMSSELFQMTNNAHQTNFGGADDDGFFVEFNEDGEVVYSSYYGGQMNDAINGIDYENGAVYITGYTRSEDKIASGGHQNKFGGLFDCFVARFEDGVRDWGTYLGGSGQDFGNNLVVKNNKIIIVGSTNSTSQISKNGFNNSLNGKFDGFFSEFRINGELLRSSYIGGSEDDFLFASDYKDEKYILLGVTYSNNLYANGHQTDIGGTADGFVAVVENNNLLKSTYYGGSLAESFYDIKQSEDIYIVGASRSDNNMAFNTSNNFRNGNYDAVIARFDANLNIVYGSYLGGIEEDVARSIYIKDSLIYIAGYSSSSDVFTKDGHQNNNNGETDAFLTIFQDPIKRIIDITHDSEFCAGKEFDINIETNFQIQPGNVFTIYLSDINGNLNNKTKIKEIDNIDGIISFILPDNLNYSEDYKFEITSSNPKSRVLSDNIKIFPKLKYTISKDTLCPQEKFLIIANKYPSSATEWYFQDELVSLSDTLNEGLDDPGNYQLKIIQKNDICQYEEIINIFIKNKIDLEIIGDDSVCINDINTYTYKTNSNNKVVWSIQGGQIYSSTDSSISVQWNTLFGALTASIPDNENDCGISKRLPINITKTEFADIVGSDTSCVDCTENYYLPNNYENYEWRIIGGEILTSNTISNITVKWESTPASLEVKYSLKECEETTQIDIYYLDEPKLQISPNISDVCVNNEILFSTSKAEFLSFTWTAINCQIIEENDNIVKILFDSEGEAELILERYNSLKDETESISNKINVSKIITDKYEIKSQLCVNEVLNIKTSNINHKIEIKSTDYEIISKSNQEIIIKYFNSGEKTIEILTTDLLSNCKEISNYDIEVINLPETPIISIIDNKIVSSYSRNKWYENNELIDIETNVITPKNNSTYYAVAINQFNCKSEPSNTITYSINSVLDSEFLIYPNPSKDLIDLIFNKDNLQINVEIIDLLGNIKYNNKYLNLDRITINHKLETGVYILKIQTHNNLYYYRKLIVE